MDKAPESVDLDEAVDVSSYAPAFGNDDLGKLQDILIGDYARSSAERIDTLEQALLGVVDDLRAEMQERVADLERRIKAESDTRATAVSNVSSRLDEETSTRESAITDLTSDLRSTEQDMQTAIDSASSGITSTVDKLRKETQRTTSNLSETKVERSTLVTFLSSALEGLEAERGAKAPEVSSNGKAESNGKKTKKDRR